MDSQGTTSFILLALNSSINSSFHHSQSFSFPGLSVMQVQYIFAFFFGVILVVGIVGNVLILLVLIDSLLSSTSSSSSHISIMTGTLMINLTISDMTFLLYNVPVMLFSFVFEDWVMGSAVCISSQSMSMWTMFCSFYTMVATSILRYMAVVHPTWSFSTSKTQRLLVCLLTWLMGFTISIPNWMHQKVIQIDEADHCMLLMTEHETFWYFVLFGGVAFLPFVLLLLVCYFRIIQSIWCGRIKVVHSSGNLQLNKKATVMILTVLIVFIIMWIPCSVIIFLSASHSLPHTATAFIASNLSSVLAYSNCSVSPLICFSLSDQFQAGLKKLFKRGFSRN
ncbi:allatostatin-A receptor-like [Microcaecilia unicolor]|uniref:Allatostatin-A receptor-like n=1 Tax=Microcaecilia unicolor TaxID=1415580 RepID=A0A6P7ZW27_9AMPH|nr:allatostatin-A receptor-like [Microcaecilia unicolor]